MNFKSFVGTIEENKYLVLLQFGFGDKLFVVENDVDEEVTEVYFEDSLKALDKTLIEQYLNYIKLLFIEVDVPYYDADNYLQLQGVSSEEIIPLQYTALDKLGFAINRTQVKDILEDKGYVIDKDKMVKFTVKATATGKELSFEDDSLSGKQKRLRDENIKHLEDRKTQPITTAEFRIAFKAIKKRIRNFLIFVGDTATGKSTAARQIAALLNAPITVTAVNEETDTVTLIGGGTVLESEDNKGINIGFVTSELLYVIEFGGIGVIEEYNMSKAEIMAILNTITDDNAFVRLSSGRIVKVHKDCVLIFTSNAGYDGTKRTNLSLLSRAGVVVDFEELRYDEVESRLTALTTVDHPSFYTKLFAIHQKLQNWIDNEYSRKPVHYCYRTMSSFVEIYFALHEEEKLFDVFKVTYINKPFANEPSKEIKKEIISFIEDDLNELEMVFKGEEIEETTGVDNDVDTDVDEDLYDDE